MLQKTKLRITAKYRVPTLKKYKKGWLIEFYYQKNGVLKRHILRCERYKKSFEKPKDAEIWITENLISPLLDELRAGWTPEQGMPNFCKNENVRISELADLFLQDAGERYEAKYINFTTYKTYKSFVQIIERALNPVSGGLENYNINDVSRKIAEKIIVRIKTQNEWSCTTANNYLYFCRMLFKFAVDNSMLAANPFAKVPLFKGEVKSKRTITPEEQRKIYAHLRDKDLPFLVFTQLVYSDLIRPVEIFRLQCKDLSVEEMKITLGEGKTKNRKSRTVYIPERLNALFSEYLKRIDFANVDKEAYLFSTDFLPKKTSEPMPSIYSSQHWRKMCKELNLPDDCKLYGLRHTGITDLLEVLPANTVRMHADHADLAQTIHYGNHNSEEKRMQVARVAPIFGGGGGAAQASLML